MRRNVMLLLFVAAVVVGWACGDGDGNDGGDTEGPSATAGPTLDAADGPTLTIVADNLKFDLKELAAPVGVVTVVLLNEDAGQPHNISFHVGDSRKGETVGESDIETGPAESAVTMQLETGEYYFLCDVHPSMKGTLAVGGS